MVFQFASRLPRRPNLILDLYCFSFSTAARYIQLWDIGFVTLFLIISRYTLFTTQKYWICIVSDFVLLHTIHNSVMLLIKINKLAPIQTWHQKLIRWHQKLISCHQFKSWHQKLIRWHQKLIRLHQFKLGTKSSIWLSLAVLGCNGLSYAILDCTWLYWAVLGCYGLS